METLTLGSTGGQVVMLQQALAIAGYQVIDTADIGKKSVDGNFGPLTQSAVQQFQTDHGLSADGVAGPNTWAAIISVTNPMGMDVSHFNSVDLTNLPEIIKFVYCKATEGATVQDDTFTSKIAALQSKNVINGAYHYLHFDNLANDTPANVAQAQVNNFLSMGFNFSAPGALPPMLDIEDNSAENINKADCVSLISAWLQAVATATRRTPVIYTYHSFWAQTLGNPTGFNNYPLWIASYLTTQPTQLADWSNYTIWQYFGGSESVASETDTDIFNGSMADLNAFAQVATT